MNEPGSTGQTLVFLNDTGLVIPCRASGVPTPLTQWMLASKLFDATELYSTSDLINNLNSNNQETHQSTHDFHHRRLHRSTSHHFNELLISNLTAYSKFRFKRNSIKQTNYVNQFKQANEQFDWSNENFKLKELPGLRYLRADGALVFPPFASSFYSPSVHHTGYVCVAWNLAGTILSAQINVKAGKFYLFFF